MILGETYWELLRDFDHWLFELTLILIIDVVIGMVAWPFAKKWLKNHDAKKHAHEHCEDVHQPELFNTVDRTWIYNTKSLCMYCDEEVEPGYLAHEKCAKESRNK